MLGSIQAGGPEVFGVNHSRHAVYARHHQFWVRVFITGLKIYEAGPKRAKVRRNFFRPPPTWAFSRQFEEFKRFLRAPEAGRGPVGEGAELGLSALVGVAGGPAALHEGLGMQLVGGFVRRIRGRLSIQGEAGFEAVVEFPVEREHAPGPPPKATETAAAREA